MFDFILRPATKADAPMIHDLIHLVGINPLGLDWKHFIVAEMVDGEFIGCAQLKPHTDGSLELASIAVKEENRRKGVARALIEHLLAYSPRPLYLMCRTSLIPFYEKFGFRVIDEKAMPHYFQRIRRIMRVLNFLVRNAGPSIMKIDENNQTN